MDVSLYGQKMWLVRLVPEKLLNFYEGE